MSAYRVYSLSFLILVCYLIQTIAGAYYPCSTPCIAKFPQCQVAFCDTENGVCVEQAKSPLPNGCCTASSDCEKQDICLLGSCNYETSICQWDPLCVNSEISEFISERTCITVSDCDTGDNCRAEKCIDGICVSSPNPDTNDPYCCQVSSDCPETPCKIAVCVINSFTCHYEPLLGCSLNSYLEPTYASYPLIPYFLPPPPPPPSYIFNGDGPKPDHIRPVDAVGTAIGGGIIVLLIMILIYAFLKYLWEKRKLHLERHQKKTDE